MLYMQQYKQVPTRLLILKHIIYVQALQIRSAFHNFKEHLSQDSSSEGLLCAQFVEKLRDYQFPSRNPLHGLTERRRVLKSNIFQNYLMMRNNKVTLGLDHASRLQNLL